MKLELRGITKRFGSLVANDNINLVVDDQEIHCLLGENGAGKSTLMNVLFGLYTADEGQILLDGKPVQFRGPGDAMAAGIGMVHQHFMLIPVFTVAENVMLGFEDTTFAGILDLNAARKRVREISDRFGFNVDPDAMVEDLSVGLQQRVEIIKALSHNAKLLVLDEPTAVLTPQETDELMQIMRQLKENGTSIIFISHKLREVKEISDKITVLRRGKTVGTAEPTATTSQLASLMVGREVSLTVEKEAAQPGPESFVIENLSATDSRGHQVLDGVNLSVRAGEVLVIAGVQGNGQTELTEALIGTLKAEGSIKLNGKELIGLSVKEILDTGVGYVPEDRTTEGLIADFTVAENMILDRSDRAPFAKGLNLQLDKIATFADEKIVEYDVRTQSRKTKVGKLSGGNQQKVALARELSRELKLFIASQPTRGLDVGSIEFVHKKIIETRDQGIPVVIVATELDEVYALADRIAVMYHGKVIDTVDPSVTREKIGALMAGVKE